ncbi:unnamed protein product [Adineta steineri]|uniref:PLAT domain-containing protein n=1 Tax=Adineta steineri TaxID=433720 RepID=A0A820FQB7_9BILA|nr:unnamed protein product [Adineta steineri]
MRVSSAHSCKIDSNLDEFYHQEIQTLFTIIKEYKNARGKNTKKDFPIHRWLDSNQSFNVLLNQGPIQLASIYTIIVRTGTISSSTQLDMHLALIGDGASTLPFHLNSNSNLIHSTNNHLFQSGSQNLFYISSFYSIDIGQLFHIQIWCNSIDKLPYYCESIEVINNFNNKKYFFLVNHWFGPNLEEYLSVPLINRNEGGLKEFK